MGRMEAHTLAGSVFAELLTLVLNRSALGARVRMLNKVVAQLEGESA